MGLWRQHGMVACPTAQVLYHCRGTVVPPTTVRLVSRDEVRLLRLGLAQPLYKQGHGIQFKKGRGLASTWNQARSNEIPFLIYSILTLQADSYLPSIVYSLMNHNTLQGCPSLNQIQKEAHSHWIWAHKSQPVATVICRDYCLKYWYRYTGASEVRWFEEGPWLWTSSAMSSNGHYKCSFHLMHNAY